MCYNQGDILIVLFPFEESSKEKPRPALFWASVEETFFVSMITTKTHYPEWEIAVIPSEINGLTKPSFIRINRTVKISRSKIRDFIPVGRLEDDILSVARQKLKEFLTRE